ncbi:WYL domain-containing protein [Litoribacillus peritrichatus]|uniref:YafY family protein n=1 Tax=Litoribacillus peritrichatus TaxID=718191 RepID=A0ABP7MI81_9GAMM
MPASKQNKRDTQFQFIDLVLAYEGEISNARIRERFDLANVQASRIISSYKEAYPNNIELKSGKGRGNYSIGKDFIPMHSKLTIGNYFNTLSSEKVHCPFEKVEFDFTNIKPSTFRLLHQSISSKQTLNVFYRSMRQPEGSWRMIYPTAYVFAGKRWHIRAYDDDSQEYRDFNIARIEKIEPGIVVSELPPDEYWKSYVELTILPHPELSESQALLIRDELFSGAASRKVTTRKALVQYVIRELELATDLESDKPPHFQIYLHSEKLVERS